MLQPLSSPDVPETVGSELQDVRDGNTRESRTLMLHNYGRQRIKKKNGSRLCSWELREIMTTKKKAEVLLGIQTFFVCNGQYSWNVEII
jgi:hypothetical protein